MELKEARRLAAALVTHAEAELTPLEQTVGRVLAKEVISAFDLPAQSRSRLDGFAILSEDTLLASALEPVILTIQVGLLAAGHLPERRLRAGECARILTGAPLPALADAVAPMEKVVEEEGRLIVKRPLHSGEGTISSGAEIRKGELLLAQGELITPTRLALIAALGIPEVHVYSRPRVALLSTGDELREIGENLEGAGVFCNNRHMLAALVRLQGGVPVPLGMTRDNPVMIADRLRDVEADLVISTGGMGRGDRDYMLQVWESLGIRIRFKEINLSPGKNCALGTRGKQLFFGFPGNPWASQALFDELVGPLLWRFQGLDAESPFVPAVLRKNIRKAKGIYQVIRGQLSLQAFPPSFTPIQKMGSSSFFGLRDNLAYVVLDSQVEEVPEGSKVDVRFHDLSVGAAFVLGSGDKKVFEFIRRLN